MIGKYPNRDTPKPLCACGCGEHVKRHKHKWIYSHFLKSNYWSQESASLGGRQRTYLVRAAKIKKYVDLLPKRLTKEELINFGHAMYMKGYHAGWNVCNSKVKNIKQSGRQEES